MSNAEEPKKSSVRIRRAEFAGQEDKFYAPSDDIRNCYLPIVRGGLAAVATKYPEYVEEFNECAKAYAKYYQDAFLAADKVDRLVKNLYDSLAHINQKAVSLCAEEITKSMLTYYGIAQRETCGHRDLTKPQIEKIAAIGCLLADVLDEDRPKIVEILAKARKYPEELDREPQEGVILEGKNQEDKG